MLLQFLPFLFLLFLFYKKKGEKQKRKKKGSGEAAKLGQQGPVSHLQPSPNHLFLHLRTGCRHQWGKQHEHAPTEPPLYLLPSSPLLIPRGNPSPSRSPLFSSSRRRHLPSLPFPFSISEISTLKILNRSLHHHGRKLEGLLRSPCSSIGGGLGGNGTSRVPPPLLLKTARPEAGCSADAVELFFPASS